MCYPMRVSDREGVLLCFHSSLWSLWGPLISRYSDDTLASMDLLLKGRIGKQGKGKEASPRTFYTRCFVGMSKRIEALSLSAYTPSRDLVRMQVGDGEGSWGQNGDKTSSPVPLCSGHLISQYTEKEVGPFWNALQGLEFKPFWPWQR